MTAEERETIVRFDYVSGKVSVWSTQRVVWGKLEKAHWTLISESKSASGRPVGKEYESLHENIRISFKNPSRKKIRTGFAINPENIRKSGGA